MIETAQPAPQDGTSADIRRFRRFVWILAVAATLAKLICAATTLGTVDVASFWGFGERIIDRGMPELWRTDPLFNHMPVVGALAANLRELFPGNPRAFAFWWRVPAILADLGAVWAVLSVADLSDRRIRIAVALLAASPVSFMVSGFHGNVDPAMTSLLVVSAALAVRGKLAPSAIALAAACSVKAACLLVTPLFLAHWAASGRGFRFVAQTIGWTLLGWALPLVSCPQIFIKNVLSYGGYWGTWGIPYWLRQTGWEPWSSIRFGEYTSAQTAVIIPLKLTIIGASLTFAWRMRNGGKLLEGLAVLWLVCMTFAPSGAPQYLVWCAPFIALARPKMFIPVTVASSVFLLIFYTVMSGGFPWWFAISRPKTDWIWLLATNIPWLTFSACLWHELRARSASEPA